MKKTLLIFTLIFCALISKAQWKELAGLTSTDSLKANNTSICVHADTSGNIYTAGLFDNSSNNAYVAKWNGTTWTELGGLNGLSANNSISCINHDKNGNIYTAGFFTNASNNRYVAKWDGISWTELGGANSLAANGVIYSICSDTAGNIYAAGDFMNASGKNYVAKWDGVSWSELGGLNSLSANGGIYTLCSDAVGNIYVAGYFTNFVGYNYVAKFNGTSWSELGGINGLTFNYSAINSLCIDNLGKIYAAGAFTNGLGKKYVAVYNGTSWAELGGVNGIAVTHVIRSICNDAAGNIYAAGYFYNGFLKTYVAQWNGTVWSALGGNTLSSNSYIESVCSDMFGNIYATGDFMNVNGYAYVAKYKFCPVSQSSNAQSICSNQTYNFNNQNLNVTGNYYDTLINYLGCDSILILNLTVNPISTSSSTQIICGTGGYLFNGQTLNATGVYYDTLTNYVGCDSIITLNLFINYPTSSTINAFICSGGSAYQFNNTSFSIPGTYYDTLINSHNCDSIITLQLSMHLPSAYSFTHSTCPNQPYNLNGKILNTTGVYYDTIPNYFGCDSIITLTLTVNTISNSVLNDTICSNNFYTFNNHNLNIAGTYYDTLTNYLGCDSIIALHLIVKQSSTLTLTQNICAGAGGYTFNGINRTITGVYYDTLSNANGCDSLITLNLFVNNPSSSSINGAICNGNNYNFNGTQLSVAGIYKDTIPNHFGCDSIISLNLSVGNPSAYSFNQIICSNQHYNFNGKICTSTGIYLDTIPNYQFCDSIITLHLTILPSSSSILSNSICIGTTYLFNNQNLSLAGTYYDTLINYLGCDSLITLHLGLKPTSSSITNASICPATSYLFNGNNYALAGSYLVHLTNYLGCDSAATLLLTIKPTSTSITNASVCVGQSYAFNGNTYNIAGSYVVHLTNYLGCDSAATLILKMNSSSSSVTNATICAGQSYTFNGNTYNSVGNYVVHLTNYVGCDSAATLNLTLSVLPTPTISVSALTTTTICMGDVVHFKFITTNAGASPIYNVLVNGISIGQTLVDTVNIPGLINGSIVTIELTNYPSCNSSLPILSNAISITVINTYIPTISISANPSGVINAGTNVIFTATPTNGGSSPQYNFKLNGSSVQNSSSATYANSSLNNGDVISCELTANNICQTTPTSTSNIILISVNATGINNEKNSFEGLSVIPNPCATCEVIVTASLQVNQLEVTNILGKSVSVQFEKTTKGYLINIPNQSAGVYFIRNIKTGQVIKFVKE